MYNRVRQAWSFKRNIPDMTRVPEKKNRKSYSLIKINIDLRPEYKLQSYILLEDNTLENEFGIVNCMDKQNRHAPSKLLDQPDSAKIKNCFLM